MIEIKLMTGVLFTYRYILDIELIEVGHWSGSIDKIWCRILNRWYSLYFGFGRVSSNVLKKCSCNDCIFKKTKKI